METQQSTCLRRKRNVTLHSMFSPCDPEWKRLNRRKRNVAHLLRRCEGRTPPAGGFPSCRLVCFWNHYQRMRGAPSWGINWFLKYFDPVIQHELVSNSWYDGHGLRWNVGREMYDKHGLRPPFLPLKSFQLMLVCKTSQSSPLYCLIIL